MLTVDNDGTPGVPNVILTSSYDAASNRTSLAAEIGGTDDFLNSYTYDALQRLTRVDQVGQSGGNVVAEKRVDFAFNSSDLLSSITRYNDTAGGSGDEVATSTFTYDTLGRLTDLAYTHSSTNLFTPYEWTYDNLSRVTQFISQDGTSDYVYDKTSQLTAADHDYQTDEAYSYDANGNRTMSGYSTGANNRLTSDGAFNYTYDDEGNRLSRTNISTSESTEYTWDFRNRLTQVTEKDSYGTTTQVVEYTYDVFNRRIGKAVDTSSPFNMADAVIERYIIDDASGISSVDGGNVVLDFVDPDGSGSATMDLARRYLYGAAVDQLLAQENMDELLSSADRVMWPLVDNLGTVRDLAFNDGTLGEHYTYDSYGNVLSGDTSLTRYLYTSREYDADTGLQYNRARWYDPATGRWISEDPIGFAAGDGNVSRYISGKVTNGTDPSGLRERQVFMAPGVPMPLSAIADNDVIMLFASMHVDGPATADWDFLDYSANFFAGFADSATFHTTDALREWAGWNDGIDHESWTYFGGEAVELVGEVIVTGGGAALRHSAAKISSRKTFGGTARSQARRLMETASGMNAHHVNTLFGHPAIKGGRGWRLSFFPSGGLPKAIYNSKLNLKNVDKATHDALHARAYMAELALYYGTVPLLVGGRLGTNSVLHVAKPLGSE